jgi:PAT family beta-lactamase induction signal transducer AmpG
LGVGGHGGTGACTRREELVTTQESASNGSRAAPKTLLQTLATYSEPRLIAVLFMGFSSGLPLALTGATLQVWQARAGVELATIGFFALVGVVYSLKFLWAPFMDRVTLPGVLGRMGRRRGWAILTQVGLLVSVVALGNTDPLMTPMLTVACAVAVAFCSASQDIVIDAYRIELLDDEQQGAGAAMTQIGYRFGMIASGWLALRVVDEIGWSAVYMLMAAFVLVGVVTVLLTREPPTRSKTFAEAVTSDSRWARVAALVLIAGSGLGAYLLVRFSLLGGMEWAAWAKWGPNIAAIVVAAAVPVALIALMPRLTRPPRSPFEVRYADVRGWLDGTVVAPFRDMASREGWWLVLLFIVLFKLGDAVAGVISSAFYVDMGFTNDEIADVSKFFGIVVTLVGVALGGLLVARIGLMRSLLVGGIVQMLSNIMFAAQAQVGHDIYFLMLTIGLENLSGGIGSAAFVAYLSGLCNVAFTGTHYALFSSLAAIGRTVLSSPGGVLVEQMGWFNYFILSTFVAIPGLLLLLYMMRRYPPPTASR